MFRALVRRFSRLLHAPSVLTRRGQALTHIEIGQLGERIAARYLYTGGAKILSKNFRAPGGGEVDIVIRHGQVLAFVEVKARTSADYGRPASAVDDAKRRLIARGVQAWLRLLHYPEIRWRCDIVEVDLRIGQPPQVTWLQSAFEITALREGRSRNWSRR